MSKYVIYTDGSSLNNQCEDRIGGWAAIVFKKTETGATRADLSGAEAGATNSAMELEGLSRALELIEDNAEVKIFSDSKYVVETFNSWVHGWVKRGWKRPKGEIAHIDTVKNIYYGLKRMGKYQLIHVKGHNGDRYNEEVDKMAVDAATKCKEELK